jgi:hypothetical protein
MRITVIALLLLLGTLSACQSIPAERTNNCACMWEALPNLPEGDLS